MSSAVVSMAVVSTSVVSVTVTVVVSVYLLGAAASRGGARVSFCRVVVV